MNFGIAPVRDPAAVTTAYRRYVLVLLTLIYLINYLDRQVLAVLLESIRYDLNLNDTQLGLLSGLAFAAFYVTFGIPFARLADNYSRRNLIVICMIVWSVMTALCGAAINLLQLLFARVGVAIGEAGCIAPAQSILADYYSPEQRPVVLSLFSIGAPAGVFLGLLLGGWLNELVGWRITLVLVGLPGSLVALIGLWSLREPIRGMSLPRDGAATPAPWTGPESFVKDVRKLMRLRTLPAIGISAGAYSMVLFGMGAWLPSFYMRMHAMSSGEVGTLLALVNGIGAGVGTLLGGFLAARLARIDKRWLCWVPAIAGVLGTPLYAVAVGVDDLSTSMIAIAPAAMFSSVFVAPSFAIAHSVAGVNLRATGLALLLFITNLVGIGGGALLVGVVSDAFAMLEPAQSLRIGLFSVLAANLLGIAGYLFAARTLRGDVQD